MAKRLPGLLGSLTLDPAARQILDDHGLGEVLRRSSSRAVRNTVTRLRDVEAADPKEGLDRPYRYLVARTESSAYATSDEAGFIVEQITQRLNLAPSSLVDKMTMLAVIATKLSDIVFLETIRDLLPAPKH